VRAAAGAHSGRNDTAGAAAKAQRRPTGRTLRRGGVCATISAVARNDVNLIIDLDGVPRAGLPSGWTCGPALLH
jgi:hypothetical protein